MFNPCMPGLLMPFALPLELYSLVRQVVHRMRETREAQGMPTTVDFQFACAACQQDSEYRKAVARRLPIKPATRKSG